MCDTILPLSQKDTCENLNPSLFLFTNTLFSLELCQKNLIVACAFWGPKHFQSFQSTGYKRPYKSIIMIAQTSFKPVNQLADSWELSSNILTDGRVVANCCLNLTIIVKLRQQLANPNSTFQISVIFKYHQVYFDNERNILQDKQKCPLDKFVLNFSKIFKCGICSSIPALKATICFYSVCYTGQNISIKLIKQEKFPLWAKQITICKDQNY